METKSERETKKSEKVNVMEGKRNNFLKKTFDRFR
jgi:hypothetical protein